MKSNWRLLPTTCLMAMAGAIGVAPREAHAQAPVYSTGPVVIQRGYVVAPAAPIITTEQTYVVPGRPSYRTGRRYSTLRPNYSGRSQLSFAPYSDAYPKSAPVQPTYYPVYPR